MLLGNTGTSSMPVIANPHEHRHQHVPEKVEGTEDGRQASELLVDPRGIVIVERRVERSGIERRPSHRLDRGRGGFTSFGGELAQVLVAEPGEAADAVSLPHGTAQQPQARDIGVRVHPAAIVASGSHGAMTALPCAQRVDTDPRQLGNRTDWVTRGRLAWRSHRTTNLTATAHPADATTPLATSASVSTNGHCRSVE